MYEKQFHGNTCTPGTQLHTYTSHCIKSSYDCRYIVSNVLITTSKCLLLMLNRWRFLHKIILIDKQENRELSQTHLKLFHFYKTDRIRLMVISLAVMSASRYINYIYTIYIETFECNIFNTTARDYITLHIVLNSSLIVWREREYDSVILFSLRATIYNTFILNKLTELFVIAKYFRSIFEYVDFYFIGQYSDLNKHNFFSEMV